MPHAVSSVAEAHHIAPTPFGHRKAPGHLGSSWITSAALCTGMRRCCPASGLQQVVGKYHVVERLIPVPLFISVTR